MIQVFARKDRLRDGFEFSMEGHAGYHPGNDIVCAGASAIVYALLGYLENGAGHVHHVAQRVKSGDVHVVFQGDEAAEGAFDMALIGILQLEKAHPEHVFVTKKRETPAAGAQ